KPNQRPEAATATSHDDHLSQPPRVAAAQGPRNAQRRGRTQNLHRVNDYTHVRVALPDRLLKVVDDSARRRRNQRNRHWQERQPTFAGRGERALGLEAALQLLEASA